LAKHTAWLLDLPKFDLGSIEEITRRTNVHKPTARLFLGFNSILDEYDEQVTVRQLYYQFVARGWIVNNAKAYSNFDKSLTKARDFGLVDWNRIIDRARQVLAGEREPTFDLAEGFDPADRVRSQIREAFDSEAYYYDLRKWHGQPYHVEVWTEKDALAGVMEPICRNQGVNLVVARGYCSYTFKMEGSSRLANDGRQGVILYFGDLDPSGWDMCEGLRKGLPEVEICRIALNPDRIPDLPANPVKEQDPRSKGFQETFPQFKGKCWELDALPPDQLRSLVSDSIARYFDDAINKANREKVTKWKKAYEAELARLCTKVDLSGLED